MMRDVAVNLPIGTTDGISKHAAQHLTLVLKAVCVGVVCYASTEIGFAHKIPPHHISALWPTGSILFSVLVFAPPRHWWLYTIAAYFTSVINDVRAGFPAWAFLFIAAGILEIMIAAIGVRRFTNPLQLFSSLRGLVVYFMIAAVAGPFFSAFIGACAGGSQGYWFYWRAWFLSEGLAYLMLAPAILSWFALVRKPLPRLSIGRLAEAGVLVGGLLVVGILVFTGSVPSGPGIPALVYLPLPLMLWAAVRFGPLGVNTLLLLIASLSISGAVHGRGPFSGIDPAETVVSLQLFLLALSVPVMLLAAVIQEAREKAHVVRESESRFRSLADSTPVMIWMSGPDKGCVYFNKRWLDFTGRTIEQESGAGWVESVHAEDRPHCLKVYADAFDARRSFEMEYRLRRSDGEHRWVLDCGIPRFMADGTFAGYVGSCLDIAERKGVEMELQEQRRELMHLSRVAIVGELSGALAHELNQPLTAILSNAQAAQRRLAQEPADLPEIREILADIVDEDKRAGEVIRRLRALLKKGETQLQPLSINEIVNEVLSLAHADFVSRGIAVAKELASKPPIVRGDRVQLQQVLLNLIANACDSMRDGATNDRRLTIATRFNTTAGTIEVSVSDCGMGIPPEKLDRLFEPFFTTKEQGLGLGLTICRTIVAAHKGRLWGVNNAGRGATFHVAIPVHDGEST